MTTLSGFGGWVDQRSLRSVIGLVAGAAVASQGADARLGPGYIRVTTEPKRFYRRPRSPRRSPGDVEVV